MSIHQSSSKKKRLNPERVRHGWRALSAAGVLWLAGVVTSRISMASAPVLSRFSFSVDARITAAIAILGIIAVVLAWVLLLPLRRIKALRDWAIALLLIVFLMTDLYLLSWAGLI